MSIGTIMEIKRDNYLKALASRMHNGMVKVVTGIRRSGKSYLLFRLFRQYLSGQGISDHQIITIALDVFENRDYRQPEKLLSYLEGRTKEKCHYYVLLDEVQLLEDFEEVLNTLLHRPLIDVYVTGSNSRFLSHDIITSFRGRGDEIHVLPLTFREFMQDRDDDPYQGLSDYMAYGGMPQIASMDDVAQKAQYLSKLFNDTYVLDIRDRYHIRRVQELNDIIDILASSIGSLTNPSRIQDTFKSKIHSSISLNTIRQYIDHLQDAFLIKPAQRFDVKGRKYIGATLKYYFEDLGLRNARLNFRQAGETHLMENLIFNELRSRGFAIDVGMVPIRNEDGQGRKTRGQLEIDFIASKGSNKYYLQSAFSIPDEDKRARETAPLAITDDSFKKVLVVHGIRGVRHDEDGITTLGLIDFLLREDSLDL